MKNAILAVFLAVGVAAVPATMRAVHSTGLRGCISPFSCVKVEMTETPKPKNGEALIAVNASSVNPSDVDTVEGGGCNKGCGADISGVVVACPGCKTIKVGDEVWTLANPAYADYVVSPESNVGLKPASLPFHAAATIPEVGLTSLFSLKRTGSMPGTPLPKGSPWKKENLTIVITEGTGGTGFIGIELAKAWGATNIVVATSGDAAIAFAKSLGATMVTDYKKGDIFSYLADDSVDVVYDNYGAEGTADKAMPKLRSPGVYLMMPHGECYEKKTQGPPCLSANPKPGVRQTNFITGDDFEKNALQALDELKDLFTTGKLTAHIDKSFALEDAAAAFAYSAGPGEGGVGNHIGKISITN
jgi:NADPH2:quinone reductase